MNRLITFIICLMWFNYASAEIVVIVNNDNPTEQLSRSEVIDLYMGRNTSFPDNSPAAPLDQAIRSEIRFQFYEQLVGKNVAEVNAYWARLLFTGRATPPRPMESSDKILQFVQDNKNAIAYLDSMNVNTKVKVVYRFEAP